MSFYREGFGLLNSICYKGLDYQLNTFERLSLCCYPIHAVTAFRQVISQLLPGKVIQTSGVFSKILFILHVCNILIVSQHSMMRFELSHWWVNEVSISSLMCYIVTPSIVKCSIYSSQKTLIYVSACSRWWPSYWSVCWMVTNVYRKPPAPHLLLLRRKHALN